MALRVAVAASVLAGALMAGSGVSVAVTLASVDIRLQPVEGVGVDCGSPSGLEVRPDLRLWNYDAPNTDCVGALQIVNDFYAKQQKHATVGSWDCSVKGGAEADRSGILIRCEGPRGPLRTLQLEAP